MESKNSAQYTPVGKIEASSGNAAMNDGNKKHVKGIRIRSLNIVMFVLSLILFVAVFWTTFRIARDYSETVRATENYIAWEKAAHQIHVASDYLTEQVRLYTQTLNIEHAINYLEELYSKQSREKALEFISNRNIKPEFRANLEKAIEYSNILTHKEIYAIRLIAEGIGHDMAAMPQIVQTTSLSASDKELPPEEKFKRARSLMFNADYANSKEKIVGALSQFLSQTLTETREEQLAQTRQLGIMISEQRIALIILCLLNAIIFLMIIILIVRPLQIYAKCIKDDKMFELVGAYEFKNLALTYNDIFAVKEHHDRMLRHKAEHDPLTGLLNRAAFDSLTKLLEHDKQPIGLILIDVDKFKSINDTYGHVMGDKTLCRVAWLIQHAFRADDFCIRLGGDEFAVLVKGNAPGLEEIIMAKITSMNEALQQPDDGMPPTSLSVGVAFSNAGFDSTLYANADKALYKVKEAGRCGCAFYDSSSASEATESAHDKMEVNRDA